MKAILSLLNKSMIRVFYKNTELLEEVITMTEPILELEFEKVERLEKELAEKENELASSQAENERLKAELEKYRSKL
jgi:cell shape-determining protein MreC